MRNVLLPLPAWGHDKKGGGSRGRSYFAGNRQNGDRALCIHLTNFCSPSLHFFLVVACSLPFAIGVGSTVNVLIKVIFFNIYFVE